MFGGKVDIDFMNVAVVAFKKELPPTIPRMSYAISERPVPLPIGAVIFDFFLGSF